MRVALADGGDADALWPLHEAFFTLNGTFVPAVLAPLVVGERGPLGLTGPVGWLLWVVWLVAYGVVRVRHPPGVRVAA